jgi:hypothetical protein
MTLWANGAGTITKNATTSPDGTNNALSFDNSGDCSTFASASIFTNIQKADTDHGAHSWLLACSKYKYEVMDNVRSVGSDRWLELYNASKKLRRMYDNGHVYTEANRQEQRDMNDMGNDLFELAKFKYYNPDFKGLGKKHKHLSPEQASLLNDYVEAFVVECDNIK